MLDEQEIFLLLSLFINIALWNMRPFCCPGNINQLFVLGKLFGGSIHIVEVGLTWVWRHAPLFAAILNTKAEELF